MTALHAVVRIGRDAETRTTANGQPVTSFPGVYNYGRKGADGNYPSQWVDITYWGESGARLAEYLTKGKVVCVILRDVHVDTYTKNDGSTWPKLVGTVIDLSFPPRQKEDSAPAQAPAPRQARPASRLAAAPAVGDEFNDEIPF
jgi:single-strand DNA-binding protein